MYTSRFEIKLYKIYCTKLYQFCRQTQFDIMVDNNTRIPALPTLSFKKSAIKNNQHSALSQSSLYLNFYAYFYFRINSFLFLKACLTT